MFVFQGFLSWSVSLVFALYIFAAKQSLFSWLGVAVVLIGIIGESLADNQLKNFKANPDNKGKTCAVGLWKYSRHPNYFFEWTIWLGFWICLLPNYSSIIGLIPVIIMYRFLTKVSGGERTEELMLKSKKRPDYADYVARTNAFFPWFPKENK